MIFLRVEAIGAISLAISWPGALSAAADKPSAVPGALLAAASGCYHPSRSGARARDAPLAAPDLTTSAKDSRRALPFSERQFRDAMAQLAVGVSVICARTPDGRFVGFTANSFNSVSLNPPLVVWTLAYKAANIATFEAAERYAINVLAHDQVELARRFSRPHADRLDRKSTRLNSSHVASSYAVFC